MTDLVSREALREDIKKLSGMPDAFKGEASLMPNQDTDQELREKIKQLRSNNRSYAQILTSQSIDALVQLIAEERYKAANKTEEHWYNAETGFGDRHLYWCKCGFKRSDFEKVDSHIKWKLAELQRPEEKA